MATKINIFTELPGTLQLFHIIYDTESGECSEVLRLNVIFSIVILIFLSTIFWK